MLQLSYTWLETAIDVSIKSLLVGVAAALALAVLRVRDCNVRHRVWTAVLAGMLAMPLLILLLKNVAPSVPLPGWMAVSLKPPEPLEQHMEVEPAPPPTDVAAADDPTGPDLATSPVPLAQAAWSPMDAPSNFPGALQDFAPTEFDDELPVAALPSEAVETEPAAPPPVEEASRSTPAPPPPWLATHWPLVLAAAWVAASTALLLRLALGIWLTFRLVRQSRPVDPYTSAPASRPRVRLLEHPQVYVPLTFGALRPAVLLPAAWRTWSGEKLQAVLAHELAHVRRRDWLVTMLAELNRAIYWFHPLAWFLKKRLAALAEQSCDDAVLEAHADRAEYARYLLEVAASLAASGRRCRAPLQSVAMARIPSVETRIDAILDSHRPLARRLGAIGVAVLLAVGIPAIILAAALRPAADRGQQRATADAAEESAEAESVPHGDAESDHFVANDQTTDNAIIHVNGRVIGPDGTPLTGAMVYAARTFVEHSPYDYLHETLDESATDAEGAFELSFSDESPSGRRADNGWKVVAFAEGFGPAWIRDIHWPEDSSPTLQLTRDHPIEGRVLDLEGDPVAGVRVKVRRLYPSDGDDAIAKWMREAKEKQIPDNLSEYFYSSDGQFAQRFPTTWNEGRLMHGEPGLGQDVVSDADGRFRVTGLGANRLALLEIEGPSIVKTILQVISRKMDTVAAMPMEMVGVRGSTYYGSEFEFLAEPTQPIVGTVKDADTGKPLAGVKVQLAGFAGNTWAQDGFLTTRTDEEGQYRLVGAPQGGGHRIEVEPEIDGPYFPTDIQLEGSSGFEPITCDVDLKPGIWIHGKVTDRDTGAPIEEATVQYLPLRSNKNAQDYANYNPNITASVPDDRYHTSADGHFRVLAIAGHGILSTIAQGDDGDRYFTVDTESVPQHLRQPDRELLLNTYQPCTIGRLHALREVDITESVTDAEYDLEISPGLTRHINLVDGNGQPITGVRVLGRNFPGRVEKSLEEAAVEIVGLRPEGDRIVACIQPEKRIGKGLIITPGEPMTVKLEPCATVRGRVVDEDGQAMPEAQIRLSIIYQDGFGRGLPGPTTGEDGRFEALLPSGLTYGVSGAGFYAKCFPAPGDVIDLGDVTDGTKLEVEDTAKLTLPKQGASQPPAATTRQLASAAAGETPALQAPVVYEGQVLRPDGKPIAGAKVVATSVLLGGQPGYPQFAHHTLGQTTSDEQGRFRLEFSLDYPGRSDLESKFKLDFYDWRRSHAGWQIVAHADGYGPAWVHGGRLEEGDSPSLQLTGDAPIEGRVVDLEGNPLPGVRVRLRELQPSRGEQAILDWIREAGEKPHPQTLQDYFFRSDDRYPGFFPRVANDGGLTAGSPALPPDASTDAQGRFTFSGLGANRLAVLEVEGPQITKSILHVVTREMEPVSARKLIAIGVHTPVHYGRKFEFVAQPSQPIEGTVTDAETSEPLADMLVQVQRFSENTFAQDGFLTTRTDDEGHYSLKGAPQGGGHVLCVKPELDEPYFETEVDVPRATSFEPITCDIGLRRGVWMRGKVTESGTGEPVVGATVQYLPLRANRHAEDYANYDPRITGSVPDERFRTSEDGSYRVLAIPGAGVLSAIAQGEDAPLYVTMTPQDVPAHVVHENGRLNAYHPWEITGYHALDMVDIPDSTDEVDHDLQFTRGLARHIHLVDPHGQPIEGARVLGRTFPPSLEFPALESPDVKIVGLRPNADRFVVFIHADRKLGKALAITPGDETTVQLVKCAAVKGRVVDGDDMPVSGLEVRVSVDLPDGWGRMLEGVSTGDDGRFEALLPPGARYRVWHYSRQDGQNFSAKCEPQSGDVIDLGDVTDGTEFDLKDTAKLTTALQPPPDAVKPNQTPGTQDVITIRGRVVDPDGNPAAGATVRVVRHWSRDVEHRPLNETTCDQRGRFEISYRKSQFLSDFWRPQQWQEASIAVFKSGFGPAWVGYRDIAGGTEPTLRLVRDDVPIEGRLVDLEGRPIAGTTVEVRDIRATEEEDLSAWLASVQKGEPASITYNLASRSLPHEGTGLPKTLQTASDGRFRVDGVGRERIVLLSFYGRNAAYTTVHCITRPIESISYMSEPTSRQTQQYVGAEFELSVPPTKVIEGTVRDANSGQPLAGVPVQSWVLAGTKVSNNRIIRTVSDQEGRYRLIGMPKGEGNWIVAVPTDEQPYFMREMKVPDTEGLAPVTVDIDLHRGVWITGRVTNKATGEPVIARLHYLPFLSNEYAAALPEFENAYNVDGFQTRYQSGPDGHYRLVGLPGRALVGAECVIEDFRSGVGVDALHPDDFDERGHIKTWGNPIPPSKKWPETVREINPPEDAESITLNLELDPGLSFELHVVGPDDQPLNEFQCAGLTPTRGYLVDVDNARCQAIGLAPDEERTLIFLNEGRKLGKVVRLNARELSNSEVVKVRLEPCATIVGRLFDADGLPIAAAKVESRINPDRDFSKHLPSIATDSDGRFRYENVPVGCTYNLVAESTQLEGGFEGVALDVRVLPGKTTDLGDMTPGKPDVSGNKTGVESDDSQSSAKSAAATQQSKSASAAASTYKQSPLVYEGQVLTPDGKPAAGAKVFLVYTLPEQSRDDLRTMHPLVVTDAKGNFRFEITRSEFGDTREEAPWMNGALVATLDGYGFGWTKAAALEKTGRAGDGLSDRLKAEYREIIDERLGEPIRLVEDDVPLTGRIIDIDGQPVEDTAIRVLFVAGNDRQDLSPLTELARDETADQRQSWQLVPGIIYGPLVGSVLPTAKTDDQGHFTLDGVGRGRVAWLQISGRGVEAAQFAVLAQRGKPFSLPRNRGSVQPYEDPFYPADFTHVAGPSRPVVGVVRDKDTKQPIARALILCQRNGQRYDQFIRTTTDAEGKYELHGLSLAKSRIAVVPRNGEPYLAYERDVDTSQGKGPLAADIELQRGIWIEGAVRDKTTGQPVSGDLWYYVFNDNPHYDPAYYNPTVRNQHRAGPDGRFRIPGLPGRGLVQFFADERERYPRGAGAETVTYPSEFNPLYCNAVQQIEPPEDAETFTIAFALEPGRQLVGRAVGPDGMPVEGGHYIAVRDAYNDIGLVPAWQAMIGNRFVIENYDRKFLKRILFVDSGHRLSGRLLLDAELGEEPTVELQPAGVIRGRVFDEEGQPLAHVRIRPWDPSLIKWAGDESQNVNLPTPVPPTSTDLSALTDYFTDDAGHFEIRGLVAGLKYNLAADTDSRHLGQIAFDVVVQSGEVKDLGDVTPVPLEPPMEVQPQDANNNPQTNPKSEISNSKSKPAAASGASSADKQSPFVYEGQVLTPDGRPAAGAKLHFVYWYSDANSPGKQNPVATTGADGRFRFEMSRDDFHRTGDSVPPWQWASLVAVADGYGMAWAPSLAFEESGSVLHELIDARGPVSGDLERLKSAIERQKGPLRLVSDEIPIRGTLVNTEGIAVAGANVSLLEVYAGENETLDAWLEATQSPRANLQETLSQLPKHLYGPQMRTARKREPIAPITTDEQGRFTLWGVGRERLVRLLIESPLAEFSDIYCRTRPGEPIEILEMDAGAINETMSIFGPEFTLVLSPSKPVIGTVSEKGTGRPLAGVVIESSLGWSTSIEGNRPVVERSGNDFTRAVTDAAGRYELRGLPRARMNRIEFVPPTEMPFLRSTLHVDTSGLVRAPAELNAELDAGVLVTGRVTDAETGRGVSGGIRFIAATNDKDGASPLPQPLLRAAQRTRANTDGNFRLVVPRVAGYLAFNAFSDAYHKKAADPNGMTLDDTAFYLRVRTDGGGRAIRYHAVASLEYPLDADNPHVEMRVSLAPIVTGTIVDPDGQPLIGGHYDGRNDNSGWRPIEGANFLVVIQDWDSPRRLTFLHREKKLAGTHVLRGKVDGELSVALQPWGTIVGRVVDEEGEPIPDLPITSGSWAKLARAMPAPAAADNAGLIVPLPPNDDYGNSRMRTDENGRFKIEGVVPGQPYDLHGFQQSGSVESRVNGDIATDVVVEPGQTLDLGDVKVVPPDYEALRREFEKQAEEAKKAQKVPVPDGKETSNHADDGTSRLQELPREQVTKVSGRIVADGDQLPSGIHLYKARVHLGNEAIDVLEETAAVEADGSFTLSMLNVPQGMDQHFPKVDRWIDLAIFATARGHGVAWHTHTDGLDPEKPITLRLVRDDVPIHGRVLDAEGNPVAGAVATVDTILSTSTGDLSDWLQAQERGNAAGNANSQSTRSWSIPASAASASELALPASVTADADGKFVVHGIGRERVAMLRVEGRGVEPSVLRVVTREMPKLEIPQKSPIYGASCTLVVWQGLTIEGVVRDAATGEPLPGVTVRDTTLDGVSGKQDPTFDAETDSEGRYRITGFPTSGDNRLMAVPNDEQPYFMREARVKPSTTPGERVVRIDFDLHRGLWITGRVTDAETGGPVKATLYYLPFLDNSFAEKLPEFAEFGNGQTHFIHHQHRYRTSSDGSFRLVGLPGRAIVAADAYGEYRVGIGAQQIQGIDDNGHFATYRNPLRPGLYWPHTMREIDPNEGHEEVHVDLEMVRGGRQKVRVLDPAGQPVTDIHVAGLGPRASWSPEHVESADFDVFGLAPGETRTVLVQQPERRLAEAVTIDMQAERPATLEVTLRPGASILGQLVDEGGSGVPDVSVEVVTMLASNAVRLASVATDQDGRFQVDNVPGAADYQLRLVRTESRLPEESRQVSVEPGETRDLGIIRLNR